MASVTSRINQVKQPYGGFVPPKSFQKIEFEDGLSIFYEPANINPGLVGLVVDYLTRTIVGLPREDAFRISLLGATVINQKKHAQWLLSQIKGMDAHSIYCACQLVGYDVCYRRGISRYVPVDTICADEKTIYSIQIMLQRAWNFWNNYGPITAIEFTFEGGYTSTVTSGDGDYLTNDTLWDFKVSKKNITSKHTLQLLMYYLMGMHSNNPIFYNIRKIGIFNPYKNMAYLLDISQVSPEIISNVEKYIIGYGTWSLYDLEIRYEKSFNVIRNYFFSDGLQFCRLANPFHDNSNLFDPALVKKWEIETQYIELGNKKYYLPEYNNYGEMLRKQLEKARKKHNIQAVKQIKRELKERGYSKLGFIFIFICLSIAFLSLFLYMMYYL